MRSRDPVWVTKELLIDSVATSAGGNASLAAAAASNGQTDQACHPMTVCLACGDAQQQRLQEAMQHLQQLQATVVSKRQCLQFT